MGVREKIENLMDVDLKESRDEMNSAHKSQVESCKKIMESLEQITKIEKKIKQRCPDYASEHGKFKQQKKAAIAEDVRKWMELRRKQENEILEICNIEM